MNIGIGKVLLKHGLKVAIASFMAFAFYVAPVILTEGLGGVALAQEEGDLGVFEGIF